MIGLLNYIHTPAAQELAIWKNHKASRKKQLKKLRSVSKAFCKSELRRFDEIIADCERRIRAEESGRIQAEMLQRSYNDASNSQNSAYRSGMFQSPFGLGRIFGF